LEVVVEVLGLALRVVEGDKVAERAEEVDGDGLLLQDHEPVTEFYFSSVWI
jgi:hypothetical protein